MRLAEIRIEPDDIRWRYRNDTYEFLTDLRTSLIDSKKAEHMIVRWLKSAMYVNIGTFLNELGILTRIDLKKYPAVVELVDSYKTEIVKTMLWLLARSDSQFMTNPANDVKRIIYFIRKLGLEWPEFAAIERSINSNQLKENDYDDDNRTPDLKGAEQYIQDVKQDFDQFGGLPVNAVINDLTYRYNLDRAQMLQVLEPIRSDIVIYINTEFGKGGYALYGAVRRVDKLHIANIIWPEIYRMLDNHKHIIVKYILDNIKNSREDTVPGFITEMVIILTRIGVVWPELAIINRSIGRDRQINETDDNIDHLPEPEQIAHIKRRPVGFLSIKNPSEAVQIAAVKKDPFIISTIANPSEAVQLAAVKKGCATIKYINNPTERVQLAAVKRNGIVLQYIDNPSNAVIDAALKSEPYALQYVKNPTEHQKMIAVSTNGSAIHMIEDPSDELIRAAVASNPRAIESINNPSLDLQISALSREYVSIFHMRSIDDRVFDHPDVKRRFMQEILRRIQRDPDDVTHVGIIMHVLKKNGVDWPELDTVKRSVQSLR